MPELGRAFSRVEPDGASEPGLEGATGTERRRVPGAARPVLAPSEPVPEGRGAKRRNDNQAIETVRMDREADAKEVRHCLGSTVTG